MCRYNFEIGEIVIAKNTNKGAGYVKGDTLKIVKETSIGYMAKNLTRPDINVFNIVSIGGYFKGTRIKGIIEDAYRITFLGIPLFTVKKVRR
jgi:hypothetical protein